VVPFHHVCCPGFRDCSDPISWAGVGAQSGDYEQVSSALPIFLFPLGSIAYDGPVASARKNSWNAELLWQLTLREITT
jgi:hypothetical protein